MATVLRIAHPDVFNSEGIPCGPYTAAHHSDHTCDPGDDVYDPITGTWSWVEGETEEECQKCILMAATDAIYKVTDDISAPVPQKDGISFESNYHHSGFSCQEQLERWMGAILDVLHDAGFALYTYEAVNVIQGRRQVAFHGPAAKLVSVLPLITE